MPDIKIKKTAKEDSSIFYKLRNSPLNRKFSLNTKNISLNEHNEWFNNNFKKKYYYTLFYNKEKIGYIRGDESNDSIYISIAIAARFKKKNIAYKCFKLFEKKLLTNSILLAKVKSQNNASINFFTKNKFGLLKKEKNILTFYKIYHKDYEKYLETISKIEKIRSGNNINWMNILRVAFTSAPSETSKIFKKIFNDDKSINNLSKKLF